MESDDTSARHLAVLGVSGAKRVERRGILLDFERDDTQETADKFALYALGPIFNDFMSHDRNDRELIEHRAKKPN